MFCLFPSGTALWPCNFVFLVSRAFPVFSFLWMATEARSST
jgi:hypothetical protein